MKPTLSGILVALLIGMLLSSCTPEETGTTVGVTDTGCWREVPVPDLGRSNVEIGGIAAISEDEIWAVGQTATSEGGSTTLTMRWDGAGWSVVPSPNAVEGKAQKNQLYAVAASGPKNVWAVGAYTDEATHFRNLAMRWDGASWKIESPPSPGLLENGLNGVEALAPSDAWAVGTQLSDESQDPLMVIFHWDGSTWIPSSLPDHLSHNLLVVKAITPNDVWAAGTDVLRWNGREWRQVPTPVDHPGGYLDGIAAISPTDVWVTGNDGNEAIAVHWDGSEWSGGKTPRLTNGPFPHDIAALGPGEVWIAGEYSEDPAYSLPMLLKWNSSGWTAITNPVPGRPARLQALTVAGGDLWAAGTQRVDGTTRPLFLRRQAQPCAATSQ